MRDSAGSNKKIEVTPQMIEAGLDAYWSLSRDDEDDERIVREVFEAMVRQSCLLVPSRSQSETQFRQSESGGHPN